MYDSRSFLSPSALFGLGGTAAAAAAAVGGGGAGGLLDPERRKRNRTFIDPVSEVPKLEEWFSHNTHPSHALISRWGVQKKTAFFHYIRQLILSSSLLRYTEELNRLPYRQKFPRLEQKNIQFWFKNRRAKCKRMNVVTGSASVGGGVPPPASSAVAAFNSSNGGAPLSPTCI